MLVGAFYSERVWEGVSIMRGYPNTIFSLCSWATWGPETGLFFLGCLLKGWAQQSPPALTGVQESGTWRENDCGPVSCG